MKALFALTLLLGLNVAVYAGGSCKSCTGCGSKSKSKETVEQKEGEEAKEGTTSAEVKVEEKKS